MSFQGVAMPEPPHSTGVVPQPELQAAGSLKLSSHGSLWQGRRQSARYEGTLVPVLILLSFVHVSASSTFFLGEAAMLALSVGYVATGSARVVPRRLRTVIFWALAVALIALIQPIFITSVHFSAVLKGFGVGVFLASDILVATRYLERFPNRVPVMLACLAGSQVFGWLLDPVDPSARATPWKYGFAIPAALIVAVCVAGVESSVRRARVTILAFAALGVINFAFNFRSMAIICLVVSLLTIGARRRPNVASAQSLLKLLIGGLVIATLGLTVYTRLAADGALGNAAQVKARQQGDTAYGAVVASRPEVWALVPAISRSPLLGLGATPTLTDQDVQSADNTLEWLGVSREIAAYMPGQPLPVHSHVLGQFAQYGIAGLFLWLSALRLLLAGIPRAVAHPQVAAYLFPAILLTWDILFSPFGADRRLADSVFLAVVASLMGRSVTRTRT